MRDEPPVKPTSADAALPGSLCTRLPEVAASVACTSRAAKSERAGLVEDHGVQVAEAPDIARP